MVRVAVNVEQLLHEAPGGIGRYTAELVRLLPAHGVDVTAFAARHPRTDVERALRAYDLEGVEPVILTLPAAVLYDAWHVLGLAGPVRRVAPVDLVHAPSPAVPPTGRVPLVVTVHDAAPLVMPEAFTRRGVTFHRQGFAAAAKRARLVIAVSDFSADEIRPHCDPAQGIRCQRVDRERDACRGCRRTQYDRRPPHCTAGRPSSRKNVRAPSAFAASTLTPAPAGRGAGSPRRRCVGAGDRGGCWARRGRSPEPTCSPFQSH
jgi:hypothetical protein